MLLVWGGHPNMRKRVPGFSRTQEAALCRCFLHAFTCIHIFTLPVFSFHWICLEPRDHSPLFWWLCDSCPSQGIRSSGALLSHHPKTKITISLCLLNCKGGCITSFKRLTLFISSLFPACHLCLVTHTIKTIWLYFFDLHWPPKECPHWHSKAPSHAFSPPPCLILERLGVWRS